MARSLVKDIEHHVGIAVKARNVQEGNASTPIYPLLGGKGGWSKCACHKPKNLESERKSASEREKRLRDDVRVDSRG